MERNVASSDSSGSGRPRRGLSPPTVAVLAYATAAVAGAALFRLDALNAREPLGLVDALFLAASAVCVTGLSPVPDLAAQLSPLGEGVLLLLVQLGGIGIVLLGALLLRMLGRRVGSRHSAAIAGSYGDHSALPLNLLLDVVATTLAIEGIGALALAWCWRDLDAGGWHAVFHAVSAFCNAGFSTFAGDLAAHAPPVGAGGMLLLLVVLGGLGFNVLRELLRRPWRGGRPLSLHARLVVRLTALLIVGGAIGLFICDPGQGAWHALFLSISARTAGFQLDDLVWAGAPTLLLLLALMVIGASPASTGGGIKTSNVAIFLRSIVTQMRGGGDVLFGERALHESQVRQAVALAASYIGLLLLFVFALACAVPAPADPRGFLALVFETGSALGTVGLSTGLSCSLEPPAKLILTVAMLAGRVGPLTLLLFLGGQARPSALRYPRERLHLG